MKIILCFRKHYILQYILRNIFFVKQYDLSVNAKKPHLLWNTFYAILNKIRSRLLHVSAETCNPSLQLVPCCYCTSAVTVLWRCSSYGKFVIHPSVNDDSKIFNISSDIYLKFS